MVSPLWVTEKKIMNHNIISLDNNILLNKIVFTPRNATLTVCQEILEECSFITTIFSSITESYNIRMDSDPDISNKMICNFEMIPRNITFSNIIRIKAQEDVTPPAIQVFHKI